ncbi:MAG TPA: cytochrome C oxidase subunit II [Flavobacteriales bacterium]|nr:cytochrome C oxidase subunit II [Flavobacteriales bacterium]
MMTFLTIVAVFLVLFVIGQVLGVFELSAKLRGRNVYDVTEKESKVQSVMMLVFLAAYFTFILWQVNKWGGSTLPVPASLHGVTTDTLLSITWWIIIPMFVLTHILLFYFAFKYVYNKNRRAEYFAHSNKLELIWTAVPTIVLTILILYGLNTWNSITTPLTDDVDHIKMELYAKQFDWTARYSGADNKLGSADVHLIDATNPVGLDVRDENGNDDIIVKGEFHLPVNVPVQFNFRSQDVIHSAYMPHFRAQMNCVPGMTTKFKFTPTITTAEMKQITKNPDFNYVLLCNKICGAAHYNMQMAIIVESQEDFDKWLAGQKPFKAEEAPAMEVEKTVVEDTAVEAVEQVEADKAEI